MSKKMKLTANYRTICDEIKKEFPDFEIIKKNDSNLMKAISKLLLIISFGKMDRFMTGFITVIGNKVYVPDSWDDRSEIVKCVTLRHERIHMRQSKRYGRLLFSLLYLLLPLPVVFAWFRKKFEQEAYEESFKALYEYIGEEAFTEAYKNHIIDHFITSSYFWMWPFKESIKSWIDNSISYITNYN